MQVNHLNVIDDDDEDINDDDDQDDDEDDDGEEVEHASQSPQWLWILNFKLASSQSAQQASSNTVNVFTTSSASWNVSSASQ